MSYCNQTPFSLHEGGWGLDMRLLIKPGYDSSDAKVYCCMGSAYNLIGPYYILIVDPRNWTHCFLPGGAHATTSPFN